MSMVQSSEYYNKKMFLMQNYSGISKPTAKCSFKAIIVKHELNLVDLQVRHCLICLNGSTATEENPFYFFVEFSGHYIQVYEEKAHQTCATEADETY